MSILNSIRTPARIEQYDLQSKSIRQTLQKYFPYEEIDEAALSSSPLASAAQWLVYMYANGLIIDDNFVLQEVSKEGYKVFDRMLDRDAHLYSSYDRMRTEAANMPVHFLPGIADDPKQAIMLSFLEECLLRTDLPEAIYEILRCTGIGFGVYEILYEPFLFKGQKKIVIKEVAHVAEDFVKSDVSRTFKFVPYGVKVTDGAEFLPLERYIAIRYRGGAYGNGLLKHAYPAYWFKRNAQIFASQYLERFGNPALVGFHDNEEQKQSVLDMMLELRSGSYASLPVSSKDLKVLEPSRQTDYLPLLNFWNDEMSKIFLFGTRTMSGSQAAGAYSATESHADEADNRTKDIVRFVIKLMNRYIIPRLIQLNFGKQEVYPYAVAGSKETESPDEYLGLLNKAATSNIKVQISRTEFYERSGLSAPNPNATDDALELGQIVTTIQ